MQVERLYAQSGEDDDLTVEDWLAILSALCADNDGDDVIRSLTQSEALTQAGAS